MIRVKYFQKKFKRVKKIVDQESEESDKEPEEEREAIANELFEGSGDVSFAFSILFLIT